MKHEVNSWVQAIPSGHCNQTNPRDDVSLPANASPLANSPPTSHQADTHDPLLQPQPSTVAASEVCDEEIQPKIVTISEVEDTEDPNRHRTCTPKAFPLPLSDSVHTLDRHAREDRPSPYLTRRCPVCFSATGAELDLSRYVIHSSPDTSS